jgi:predicted methyltransferase MtxX (methanogen marker protein 4)
MCFFRTFTVSASIPVLSNNSDKDIGGLLRVVYSALYQDRLVAALANNAGIEAAVGTILIGNRRLMTVFERLCLSIFGI